MEEFSSPIAVERFIKTRASSRAYKQYISLGCGRVVLLWNYSEGS